MVTLMKNVRSAKNTCLRGGVSHAITVSIGSVLSNLSKVEARIAQCADKSLTTIRTDRLKERTTVASRA
jgi:hypothetical protein